MMENKTKIDLKNKSIFITGVAGYSNYGGYAGMGTGIEPAQSMDSADGTV